MSRFIVTLEQVRKREVVIEATSRESALLMAVDHERDGWGVFGIVEIPK